MPIVSLRPVGTLFDGGITVVGAATAHAATDDAVDTPTVPTLGDYVQAGGGAIDFDLQVASTVPAGSYIDYAQINLYVDSVGEVAAGSMVTTLDGKPELTIFDFAASPQTVAAQWVGAVVPGAGLGVINGGGLYVRTDDTDETIRIYAAYLEVSYRTPTTLKNPRRSM